MSLTRSTNHGSGRRKESKRKYLRVNFTSVRHVSGGVEICHGEPNNGSGKSRVCPHQHATNKVRDHGMGQTPTRLMCRADFLKQTTSNALAELEAYHTQQNRSAWRRANKTEVHSNNKKPAKSKSNSHNDVSAARRKGFRRSPQ